MWKPLLLILLLLPVAALPMAWRIERVPGAAAGDRSCTVISLFGAVRARLSAQGRAGAPAWVVRVGEDNQPGSLRYLRIGKRIFQTDRERFQGAEAAEIVARLKMPGSFAFEWAAQPGYAKHAGLYETGNFAEQAAICEDWMTGTRT